MLLELPFLGFLVNRLFEAIALGSKRLEFLFFLFHLVHRLFETTTEKDVSESPFFLF